MSTQVIKSNYELLLRLYYKKTLSSTNRNRIKTLAILSYRIFLSYNLLKVFIVASIIIYYITTS